MFGRYTDWITWKNWKCGAMERLICGYYDSHLTTDTRMTILYNGKLSLFSWSLFCIRDVMSSIHRMNISNTYKHYRYVFSANAASCCARFSGVCWERYKLEMGVIKLEMGAIKVLSY